MTISSSDPPFDVRRWPRRFARLVDGVVVNDPRARIRALQLFYVVGLSLSAFAATVARHDNWIAVALARLLTCLLVVGWLSRRDDLGPGEAVVFLGVLPAISFITAASYGVPGADVRVTWAVLIAALAAILWSRRVALVSGGVVLGGLGVVDLTGQDTETASLNLLGFAIGVGLLVLVVNGAAMRLRATVTDLRRAQANLDRAGEQERAKIATELHDDTIQVMTAASMKLDGIRHRPQSAGEAAPDLTEALDLMQQAISRARRLSFDLYPPVLGDGIGPALREAVARVEQDAPFTVRLEITERRLPRESEELVYRTARELLEKARKHSRAQVVDVSVMAVRSSVVLIVADDGCGFDPGKPAGDGEFHFGLHAAQERVKLVGGVFALDSAPGRGTTVHVRLPVRVAHESI